MLCVQGMSVTRARQTTYEDYNNYAHVHMFMLSFVLIGVGRLNVQQDGFVRQLHFTTPSTKFCSSGCVVRLCPVIVHSICIQNSCIFHIAKTGLLRCCLDNPRNGMQVPVRTSTL